MPSVSRGPFPAASFYDGKEPAGGHAPAFPRQSRNRDLMEDRFWPNARPGRERGSGFLFSPARRKAEQVHGRPATPAKAVRRGESGRETRRKGRLLRDLAGWRSICPAPARPDRDSTTTPTFRAAHAVGAMGGCRARGLPQEPDRQVSTFPRPEAICTPETISREGYTVLTRRFTTALLKEDPAGAEGDTWPAPLLYFDGGRWPR